MEARSKTIEAWFSMIEQAQVKLPRFQRHEAWRPRQIAGVFENILRAPSLPIGVLLVLEVGDRELFHSRPVVGAPASSVKPNMHVLDGQQRITALWRSLTDDYPDLRVFIRLTGAEPAEDVAASDDDDEEDQGRVVVERRWLNKKGEQQPAWAFDDALCAARGLAPITILRPGSVGEARFKAWRNALRAASAYTDEMGDVASDLRQRLGGYVLPFLELPASTARETALEVFKKMNTSASPLKDFDIVVAQVEEAVGESLHDKMADLLAAVPAAKAYGRIEDLILAVGALLQDKPPLKKTYLDDSYGKGLVGAWPQLEQGVRLGTEFLAQEGLLNADTLPSDVAVYLTCAMWSVAGGLKMDQAGNARQIIRKALWRACCTHRYGKTSATRAYADFRALRVMMTAPAPEQGCELFDTANFPLPGTEELRAAGWPGRKDRLPRAILAAALRRRALDFADGSPISRSSIGSREMDHLYSVKFLDRPRADTLVNRALNCALITDHTNRNKSGTRPSVFIAERAAKANLGIDTVRHRLASHLIPHDALVADDYEAFLEARAALVMRDLLHLCDGQEPQA
ncbi:DUF262 domain-containing protein [Falsiroseomonas ponticola]|uniref:DUF262 domain-containing protein n=1 Tax=Falsiroseomonas ponticola TaxID=2786951 RepID=UPI001933E044|nr:DUF262 domain-containing protein [Roseomonas ponticola]